MPEAQINQSYHLLMALCNEKNVWQRLNKENLSPREIGHAIFSTFNILQFHESLVQRGTKDLK